MLNCIEYFVSNYLSILTGSAVVVGSVIFLLGCIKSAAFNRIPNKLVRKIMLSLASLVLVLPATAVSLYSQHMDFAFFWLHYGLNAAFTILVYWFYENTGARNLLEFVGKKTVLKTVHAICSKAKPDKSLLIDQTSTEPSQKNYKEDDIKNL